MSTLSFATPSVPAPSLPAAPSVTSALNQRYTGVEADTTLTYKKRKEQLDKYMKEKRLKDAKKRVFRNRFALLIMITVLIVIIVNSKR